MEEVKIGFSRDLSTRKMDLDSVFASIGSLVTFKHQKLFDHGHGLL